MMTPSTASALIKRFVEEPGSKRIDTVLAGEPILATSQGGTPASPRRACEREKLREKALTTARLSKNVARLRPRLACLRAGRSGRTRILFIVCDLVRRHPLRGFDAIHLASAMRLQEQLGEEIRVVASDDRLLTAGREGRASDTRRPALSTRSHDSGRPG